MFRYYSLGVDTVMPGGLYAGLCHVFLVIALLVHVGDYAYVDFNGL